MTGNAGPCSTTRGRCWPPGAPTPHRHTRGRPAPAPPDGGPSPPHPPPSRKPPQNEQHRPLSPARIRGRATRWWARRRAKKAAGATSRVPPAAATRARRPRRAAAVAAHGYRGRHAYLSGVRQLHHQLVHVAVIPARHGGVRPRREVDTNGQARPTGRRNKSRLCRVPTDNTGAAGWGRGGARGAEGAGTGRVQVATGSMGSRTRAGTLSRYVLTTSQLDDEFRSRQKYIFVLQSSCRRQQTMI